MSARFRNRRDGRSVEWAGRGSRQRDGIAQHEGGPDVAPTASRTIVALRTIVTLSAGVATPADAHLVQTGFGAFYDGVAHVAATPADLLVVAALALLAGQKGVRAARYAFILLPAAWLAGGIAGSLAPSAAALPLLTTLSFTVVGVLVALNAKVHDFAVVALTAAAGLLHGYVNGSTMAPSGSFGLALAGTVSAIFCATVLLSAEVTALPVGWPRVVVRVAGSWIAASGLLMLGWLARTAP